MATWFECSVRFDKTMENGVVKKVTEVFLVDAISFTEAEARITEEITPFLSGDFTIPAIKKTKVAEVFFNNKADKWWLIKYNIITLDEKRGVEKKAAVLVMVQADDQQGASDSFNESMSGTLAEYEISSVSETKIMDVYPVRLSDYPQ